MIVRTTDSKSREGKIQREDNSKGGCGERPVFDSLVLPLHALSLKNGVKVDTAMNPNPRSLHYIFLFEISGNTLTIFKGDFSGHILWQRGEQLALPVHDGLYF